MGVVVADIVVVLDLVVVLVVVVVIVVYLGVNSGHVACIFSAVLPLRVPRFVHFWGI